MRVYVLVFLVFVSFLPGISFGSRGDQRAAGRMAPDANVPPEFGVFNTSVELHASHIFGEMIPNLPQQAVSAGLAEAVSITLSRDLGFPDNRVWIASPTWINDYNSFTGSTITHAPERRLISPLYGAGYTVRVFYGGNEISRIGDNPWYFDYRSGVLVFEKPPTGATGNTTGDSVSITAYRYTGKMVSDGLGSQEGLIVPGTGGVITNMSVAAPGMFIQYRGGGTNFALAFSSVNRIIVPNTPPLSPVDELEFEPADGTAITLRQGGQGGRRAIVGIPVGTSGGGGVSFTQSESMIYSDSQMNTLFTAMEHGSILTVSSNPGNPRVPQFLPFDTVVGLLDQALKNAGFITGDGEEDPHFNTFIADAGDESRQVNLNYLNTHYLNIDHLYDDEGSMIESNRVTLAGQSIYRWEDLWDHIGTPREDADTLQLNTLRLLTDDATASGSGVIPGPRNYITRAPVVHNAIQNEGAGNPQMARLGLVRPPGQNPFGVPDTFPIRALRAGEGIRIDYVDSDGAIRIAVTDAADVLQLFDAANTLYYRDSTPLAGGGQFRGLSLASHDGTDADNKFVVQTGPGLLSLVDIESYITNRFVISSTASVFVDTSALPSDWMVSRYLERRNYRGHELMNARNHVGRNLFIGASTEPANVPDGEGGFAVGNWHSLRLQNGLTGEIDDNGVLSIYWPGSNPSGSPMAGFASRVDPNTFSATNTFMQPIVIGSGGLSPIQSPGGNRRGAYAVDLQTYRVAGWFNPEQVASGAHSFLGPGQRSIAAGAYSFIGTAAGSRSFGPGGFIGTASGSEIEAGAQSAFIGTGAGNRIYQRGTRSAVVAGSSVSIFSSASFVGSGAGITIGDLGTTLTGGGVLSAANSDITGSYGILLGGTGLTAGGRAIAHGINARARATRSVAIGQNISIDETAHSSLGFGSSVNVDHERSVVFGLQASGSVGSHIGGTFNIHGESGRAASINLSRAPTATLDVGGAIRISDTHHTAEPGTIRYLGNANPRYQFAIPASGGGVQWIDLSASGVGVIDQGGFDGTAESVTVTRSPENYTSASSSLRDHLIGIDDRFGDSPFIDYNLNEASRQERFVFSPTNGSLRELEFRNAIHTVSTPSDTLTGDIVELRIAAGDNMAISSTKQSISGRPNAARAVLTISSTVPQGPAGARLYYAGIWDEAQIPYAVNTEGEFPLVFHEGSSYFLTMESSSDAPHEAGSGWQVMALQGPEGPEGRAGPTPDLFFTWDDDRVGISDEPGNYVFGPSLRGPAGANVAFMGEWDDEFSYSENQLVAWNGYTYFSGVDNNMGNEPEPGGTDQWAVFIDGDAIRGRELEFSWFGTELGIRYQGDGSYTFSPNLRGPPGAPGAAGLDLRSRGTWDANHPGGYAERDWVVHDGRAWYATASISEGVTQPPGENPTWLLFVDRGERGENGEFRFQWEGTRLDLWNTDLEVYEAGPDLRGVPGAGLSVIGPWEDRAGYSEFHAVIYDGSVYYATTTIPAPGPGDSSNASPEIDTSRWELFVAKGDEGQPGTPGEFFYEWRGTELGVASSASSPFSYVDLLGPQGNPGVNARWAGNYSSERDVYTTNDIVRYDRVLYIPTENIDQTSVAISPPNSPWVVFLRDGVDGDHGITPVFGVDYRDGADLQYWGPWQAEESYPEHVLVTRLGTTYYSRRDGNTSVPETSPNDWHVFVRGGEDGGMLVPRGNFILGTPYDPGDLVFNEDDGGTYYALQSTTATVPGDDPLIWQMFSPPPVTEVVIDGLIGDALAAATTATLANIDWDSLAGNVSFAQTNSILYSGPVLVDGEPASLELFIGSNTNFVLSPGPGGIGLQWRDLPTPDLSGYVPKVSPIGDVYDFRLATRVLVPNFNATGNSAVDNAMAARRGDLAGFIQSSGQTGSVDFRNLTAGQFLARTPIEPGDGGSVDQVVTVGFLSTYVPEGEVSNATLLLRDGIQLAGNLDIDPEAFGVRSDTGALTTFVRGEVDTEVMEIVDPGLNYRLPGNNANWQQRITGIERPFSLRMPLKANINVSAEIHLVIDAPGEYAATFLIDAPEVTGFVPEIPQDTRSEWLLMSGAGIDTWTIRRLL